MEGKTMEPALFSSVSSGDHLDLIKAGEPVGEKIVDFFRYKKEDVSKATGVAKSSIRYDSKMPLELRNWLLEWATAINLVAGYFKDLEKTALWFQIPNPLLGNISPRDMIRVGRFRKLLKFIQTALEENIISNTK